MSGSVLREAAAQGDVEYLKELLETGGNPCSTDDNGLNALHFAVWNGHVEAVELLVVNDVGCPTLPANTRAKLEDAKSKWLQGYIARDNHDGTYDVNFEDGSSEQAIEKRKIRQAEKEDGTLYPKPKEGKAWKVNMICLARYSHKRDTSNLVSTDGSYGGAAFNQEQYDAEQAIAAAQQHLEQLEKNRLKKKPQASCVTGVTEAGWSALHICAMGSLNDVECAQILLEAGVSPLMPVWKSTSASGALAPERLIQDKDGRTAYDVALESRNVPLAALLRRPRPDFDRRRRAMRTYRNRCLIQDKPKRPPPPYYDTIEGEPPLPEIIIETDDEAEPEEKNLLELVVEKKARIDAVLFAAFPERSKQEWGALVKQGRVQVDGKTMSKKKSVEANALVVVELPPPSRPQTAVETFDVGDLVQVGDDRGVVTQLPVKGKGPWKITVGDEPHPRKLKTCEFTKLDEPEEEEEKDLGGEDHATDWVAHEKFLADERLESWDGTTQRPVQLADPPKELLIPEHLQLKYAKESFTIGTARKDGSRRKRGPHIIQNLIFAVREADKNFERREMLAAEQEQFLDHEAIAKAERNKLKSTRDRRNVLEGMSMLGAATGGGMETGGYAI